MKKAATKRSAKSAPKPKKSARDATKAPQKIDPDRADAAVEVLQAVFLHEKHFDLESEIVLESGRPVVDTNAEGHLWVTVRLHVPMLDVDTWLDGTHLDHPDNQPDDDEDGAR